MNGKDKFLEKLKDSAYWYEVWLSHETNQEEEAEDEGGDGICTNICNYYPDTNSIWECCHEVPCVPVELAERLKLFPKESYYNEYKGKTIRYHRIGVSYKITEIVHELTK